MELRNYQQRAVDAITESLGEHQSTLMVKPTGTGKTVVFCHVAQRFI